MFKYPGVGLEESGEPEADELEKIEITLMLEGIYQLYGYDFRNYTYPFLKRRIKHRMRIERVNSVSALQDRVLHQPKILQTLVKDLSINVTEMFRDPSFFISFRKNVVPRLREYPSIRIWHAGCSTGEEVFSMAILLHEEGLLKKTTIYATDMSDNLLTTAKERTFELKKMQRYTRNYLNAGGQKAFSEYYSANSENACFHPFLAGNIVFAQHNLVTDCSFNEFHAIVCRNVLIYFNLLNLERVHRLFYESLCFNGFLGLGSKEGMSLSDFSKFYKIVDPDQRIYQRAIYYNQACD